MKQINIVELDGHSVNPLPAVWQEMAALGHFTTYDHTPAHLVVARSQEADALLINKIELTADVFDRLPRLRYVGVLATGYNVVDLQAAHERGITVTNIPAYSTDSVAQGVMALLLAVTNRVEHYANANRAGRWSQSDDFCYWDTPLTELAHKQLGIVGFGHIGRRVATLAQAFGMHVAAVTSKPQEALPEGIAKLPMDEMLLSSHVVSLHCPLNTATTGLIGARELSLMRPDAVLINTARGAIVDEQAVARALHEGQIAAYGADVMTQEPPHADHPLLHEPHAFITPHNVWATRESLQRLRDIAVSNLSAWLQGRPQNVVG